MRYVFLFAATALALSACDESPKTTPLDAYTTPNNWKVIKLFEEPNGCAAYYARPIQPYSEWEPFKYVVCTEGQVKASKTFWDTTEYSGVGKMRHARTVQHEVGTTGGSPAGPE